MIRSLCALVIASVASASAAAADSLVIGPAPAWIKPVRAPTAPTPTEGAPVHILLQDQQVDLQPGKITRYFENIVRIDTPEGLSAGNVSLSWNPKTEIPIVHKLIIQRGDKSIDVLASQSFTVVRRENNLENAILDGVLTATIQPETLQVGDIVDFSGSIIRSDPVLGGHVEQIGAGWNGLPFARGHLRVRWPSTTALRLRGTTGLPPLKPMQNGAFSELELSMDDVQPLPSPKDAPARYSIMRIAEMTDFGSWGDAARLLSPLYRKAATLPPGATLRAEVAAIAARSADAKSKVEAALALVQDRVRYVSFGLNEGSLVPVDAETTWQRRFGDGKGKTALLVAILHELGIDAVPVMVSRADADGMEQRLPMIGLFDHALVRTTIADKTYWLDGTRTGDKSLDRIKMPDFRWGLPLVAGAELVRMDAPPTAEALTETTIRIDASGGITLPAPAHAEIIMRDDSAVALNQQLANLTPDARGRQLRDFWHDRYDFITVTAASASFDPEKREERLTMDGAAKMEWDGGWYEADGVGVGYRADFSREAGPNSDAPFAVAYPYSSRTRETILLPPGRFGLFRGDAIDVTVAGLAYKRTATLDGNRFTVEEEEHSVAREFPASAAVAAQAQLRDLADKTVHIHKLSGYRMTDPELAEAMRITPTTAQAFVERGYNLIDRQRFDEAIADFDRAIAIDPKYGSAYANRGIALIWQNKLDQATRDLDTAEKIDARNSVVCNGRGMIADARGLLPAAIAAYSRAIEIDPDSIFAVRRRADDYRKMGDNSRAIADLNLLIARSPQQAALFLIRANIYLAAGNREEALRQADLVVAAGTKDGFAQVVAGRILARLGKADASAAMFDAALKAGALAYVHINRSLTRQTDDYAKREADLDAAAKLAPKSTELFAARAGLAEDRRAFTNAIDSWTASIELNAEDAYALVRRGIDWQLLGRTDLAVKDFAAARALGTSVSVLGTLCREKARAGTALDLALEECKAALMPTPNRPDFLISLGLVQLRLGRLDEAATAYDAVLRQMPNSASALYGRALIDARRGNTKKAKTGWQAAIVIDPDVVKEYADLAM